MVIVLHCAVWSVNKLAPIRTPRNHFLVRSFIQQKKKADSLVSLWRICVNGRQARTLLLIGYKKKKGKEHISEWRTRLLWR